MKTNTGVFAKAKCELKCKNELGMYFRNIISLETQSVMFSILRLLDKLLT
jgi:hypothetical protein